MENFHGKGIEEIAPVDLWGNGIFLRTGQNEFCAGFGGAVVFQSLPVDPGIVFDADGSGSGLGGKEKTDSALAASVVQHRIRFSEQSAVRQTLQNGVGGWLVGVAVFVSIGVVPTHGPDVKQIVPFVFVIHCGYLCGELSVYGHCIRFLP